MLETLADHDDELMEQLLADMPPPRDRVFDDLAKELRDGLVCPVLMGVATRTNGVLRLLKALRHEAPGMAVTAKRLGVKANGDAVGNGAEDLPHHAWRQAVGGAGALRPDRRRRDLELARGGGGPGLRRIQAHRTYDRKARTRGGRRNRRVRQARTRQDRRHAVLRQAAACRRGGGKALSAACWRSRFPPRSARTT